MALNMWLDESQLPPYCLIAAPAGMGKSALLAHWWYQLEQRKDLFVLFFSICIRFDTNLAGIVFPALVQRLAAVLKKQVSFPNNMTPEEWQGQLVEYLALPLPNGKRLVLILDGVDEAADWSIHPGLFPLRPHKNTRVILSARTTGDLVDAHAWSRLLGGDQQARVFPIDLDRLTRVGVEDVLQDATLSEELQQKRALIAEQLYRLSLGDPLVVQINVKDLQTQGILPARLYPEDLQHLKEGLNGYFEDWWSDQRKWWGDKAPLKEALVQAVFQVLACALGPMDRHALAQMLPPDFKKSSLALQDALEPLARLISGDGQRQGYAFNHPRLAEHFYGKMEEAERSGIEAHFLSWGAETLRGLNEGTLHPQHVHPYLIQYYGPHMWRASQRDEQPLFSPVSNGWRQAWEEYEGLYAGFLADVSRAWQQAEHLNRTALQNGKHATHLEVEVLCALYQASVTGAVGHIPPRLLVEGIKRKVFKIEQGLAYARQLLDVEQQAAVLIDLLSVLSKSRQRGILRELLDLLPEVKSGPVRVRIVEQMSQYLSGPLLHEARITLRTVENQQHYLLEAEVALFLRLSPRNKDVALQEAWERIQALKFNEYQEYKEVLVRILIRLAEHSNENERPKFMREALTIAQQISEPLHWASALISLIPLMSEEDVQGILSKVRGKKYAELLVRAHAARKLSSPSEKGHLISEILRETLLKKPGAELADILIAVIDACSPSQVDLLWQKAQSYKDLKESVRILLALATRVPVERQQDILHEIEGIIPQLPSVWLQALTYSDLSHLLLGLSREIMVHKAIETARKVQDFTERTETLLTISDQLSQKDQEQIIRNLWNAVHCLDDERDQVRTLSALGSVAPPPHNIRLLHQAEEKARHLSPERTQVKTLINLLQYIPGSSRVQLAQELLERAQHEFQERDFAFLLRDAIPFLPKDLLQEMLVLTSKMNTNRNKVLVLASVACALSKDEEGVAVAQDALSLFPLLQGEKEQGELIELLAPCCQESLLPVLWQLAYSLKEMKEKIRALIYVFKHLPLSFRQDKAEELFTLYRTFQPRAPDEVFSVHIAVVLAPYINSEQLIQQALHLTEKMKSPGNRIRALLDLLSTQDLSLKDPLLREAIALLPRMDDEGVASVVSEMIAHLLPLEPPKQYEHWNQLLHALAKHPRSHFLQGLAMLPPLLISLGGKEAIVPISQAVVHIGMWWK